MDVRSEHTNHLEADSLGPESPAYPCERAVSHPTPCHPCLILQSARADLAPHPALILLHVDINYSEAGCKSCEYFRFVCEDCGTILAKEFPGRKHHAGWVFFAND